MKTIIKEYNRQDMTTKVGVLIFLGILVLLIWTIYGIATGQADVKYLN